MLRVKPGSQGPWSPSMCYYSAVLYWWWWGSAQKHTRWNRKTQLPTLSIYCLRNNIAWFYKDNHMAQQHSQFLLYSLRNTCVVFVFVVHDVRSTLAKTVYTQWRNDIVSMCSCQIQYSAWPYFYEADEILYMMTCFLYFWVYIHAGVRMNKVYRKLYLDDIM